MRPMFRAAEGAVECCGHRNGNWTLTAADHALLAPVLALHDRQLGLMSSRSYDEGWTRLRPLLHIDAQSPLPSVPEFM